jgi:hypothetical protein
VPIAFQYGVAGLDMSEVILNSVPRKRNSGARISAVQEIMLKNYLLLL